MTSLNILDTLSDHLNYLIAIEAHLELAPSFPYAIGECPLTPWFEHHCRYTPGFSERESAQRFRQLHHYFHELCELIVLHRPISQRQTQEYLYRAYRCYSDIRTILLGWMENGIQ